MFKKLVVTAACLLMLAPLAACTGTTDDQAGSDKPLVTLAESLSGTGQPWYTATSDGFRDYYQAVFDWAIEQGDDGRFIPGLATEWNTPDDGLTWVFDIRDDVVFHDGDPLTAEDVAWSWQQAMFDPESQKSLALYAADLVDSVTADGNKVTVTLKRPDSALPLQVSTVSGTQAVIQNQSYWEEVGPEEASEKPIGTGPYQFTSADGERSVELAAFESDEMSDWQKERIPSFKTLIIRAVPEVSTRLALLTTGEADVAPLPLTALSQAEGAQNWKAETAPNGSYSVAWCLGNTLNADSPCDDVRVREALSIAIDRQTIADTLYAGSAQPSNGFYAGTGTFGSPDDLEPPAYDPDRAQDLLDDAGFNESNPLKVELVAYSNDADFPNMPALAEAMAAYLEEIGVEATITTLEEGASKSKLYAGEYPGQRASSAVSPVTLWMRGSDNKIFMLGEDLSAYTQDGKIGSAIWDHQALPEMSQLLSEAAATVDEAEQEAKYEAFNEWMAENWMNEPLLTSDVVFGVSNRVAEWTDQVRGRSYVHNQWSMKPAE